MITREYFTEKLKSHSKCKFCKDLLPPFEGFDGLITTMLPIMGIKNLCDSSELINNSIEVVAKFIEDAVTLYEDEYLISEPYLSITPLQITVKLGLKRKEKKILRDKNG